MKILVTGISGQVGHELACSLVRLGEVIAVDRARMDLTDIEQVRRVIREVKPDLIVNPAAYTAVDKAESEPALARAINAVAPAVMAEEAKRLGAAMIHYSTDYVFDGSKQGPYVETDPVCPINVYGKTKAEGEQAVIAAGGKHLILRSSWVYGTRGRNFLLTMLRLGRERDELRVVDDQVGAPTWSRTIADVTARLMPSAAANEWWERHGGIYNLTSRGRATWHSFAQAILDNAGIECRVVPVPSSEYKTPASRPANSQLRTDKLALHVGLMPEWQGDLMRAMTQIRQQKNEHLAKYGSEI